MQNKKNENIDWLIISRNLFGEATHAEKLEFEAWLKKSPKHRKYAEQSANFYADLNSGDIEKPNPDEAIKAFKLHLSRKKRRKTARLHVFLRYVAVILIPVGIATILLTINNIESGNVELESRISAIEPGSSKAELLLASGKVIHLEEQDTLLKEADGTKIHNQSGMLQYKNNEKKPKKETHNSLKIPQGGEYRLQLSDGTKVWLNSATSFKYPTHFVGNKRIVYLEGEAFFEVAHNSKMPFVVKTKNMNVKVFGTQFNVMAYQDEAISQTTLVEGSVGVEIKNETGILHTAMLKPNMQAEYLRGNVKGNIKEVRASLYTGWKNGKFQFDDEDLGSIMRKLSRWYGVKFFVQNQQVRNQKFSGEMKRFEDFSSVLNLLEYGSKVKFEIQEDFVIVKSTQ